MVLAIGLNASFLLAFSAYLLHVSRSRLEELLKIRSGLEREVLHGQRRRRTLPGRRSGSETQMRICGDFLMRPAP